jgi:hypothetical protein
MIAGISVKHILANALRVDLDDHDYGDIIMEDDGPHSWNLYRDGNLVGWAKYTLDNIIVKVK